MQHHFQSSLSDIRAGLFRILQGEVQLAAHEAKQTFGNVLKQSKRLVLAAGLAILSAVFLLVFLFTGLADLLGDNYWLSALLLMAAFAITAAIIGAQSNRTLKTMDLKLPRTRRSLQEQKEALPRPIADAVDHLHSRLQNRPKIIRSDLEAAMLDAKLEVASGHELIHSGLTEVSALEKDLAELGRNFLKLGPELESQLKKAGPAAAVIPGLVIGLLVSRNLRKSH